MPAADFFSTLEKHFEKELPLVAYRKPGGVNLKVKALLQQSGEIYHVKDYSESGFVFAPFDDEKQAIFIPWETSEKMEIRSPASAVKKPEFERDQKEISSYSEVRKEHISLIEKAIKKLKEEDLKKVVLSRKEEFQLKKEDPVQIFRELLQLYPEAFVYLFYHPQVGCWLGATPETLLEVKRNQFKTMALAGTKKFSGSSQVEWGEKEKQEQQYVTDYILENLELSLSGKGKIETSDVFTSRAGNLLHLRTDIRGDLPSEGNHIKSIIEALHPTPAVCGFPKQEAKKFILEQENYDREFYTGFLGELNLPQQKDRRTTRRNIENRAYFHSPEETSLFVNLRCMKIIKENAVLYIGGGITADSNAEEEWQETVNKAETMKAGLLK